MGTKIPKWGWLLRVPPINEAHALYTALKVWRLYASMGPIPGLKYAEYAALAAYMGVKAGGR